MEKIILPTKTKIAAWWMIVIGGISMVIFLGGLILLLQALMSTGGFSIGTAYFLEFLFSIFILSPLGIFFLFLPGFFLLKRRGWVWRFAITLLSIGTLINAIMISIKPLNIHIYIFVIFFAILLIPFILLIIDRKNFWKIAS